MAPAVLTPPAFSRSRSTPVLPTVASLKLGDSQEPRSTSQEPHLSSSKPRRSSFLRSKILPDTPDFDVPTFNTEFDLGIPSLPATRKHGSVLTKERAVAPVESPRTRLGRLKDGEMANRRRTWFLGSKAGRTEALEATSKPSDQDGGSQSPVEKDSQWTKHPRRSWMMSIPSNSSNDSDERKSSKTSSPQLKPTIPKATHDRLPRLITSSRLNDQASQPQSPQSATKPVSKASNYLAKMKIKHSTTIGRLSLGHESDQSYVSSATSLSKRGPGSIDTYNSLSSSWESNSPTTDESSGDTDMWNKDPLWSSFKTLEIEYKGFISKQTSARVIQIESVLLPFLRNTAGHRSNKKLRLEDLDRRASVMNKWWLGMLEMLDGSKSPAQYPLPPGDRPIVLEAVDMIMTRPEWRWATSYYRPLTERSPRERVSTKNQAAGSRLSISSSQAEYLAESAEHNVRTMYQINLMKQMRFVVEKMTLRDAPPGLVSFAAKTCAYAFFFAPGVCDILLRLWGLSHDLLRRTGEVFHLPKRNRDESDDIVALFPPHLSSYGWSSPQLVWHRLTQTVKMHVQLSGVHWTGPWISRWKGLDSDLFFLFCKNFHILADEFIPSGLPLVEKARSPAFAIVHAQMLAIIDTTIRRQLTPAHLTSSPLLDFQEGADATALGMPAPSTSLAKGMSHNKVIILLRNWLSDLEDISSARDTFSEATASIIKATALRTQQYNSVACFNLCDFLEEALMIFYDYDTLERSNIDWSFWLQVCKKMLASQHTMSEVRVLSFVYTIWDAIGAESQRKLAWSVDWLLSNEIFSAYFNHWSPMVRAYYHRFLCWRICRDGGTTNEVDARIFVVVSERLMKVWSHYLFLKQDAAEHGKLQPSSAPSLPALGKRFIIIRQDAEPKPFTNFDQLSKSPMRSPVDEVKDSRDMIPSNGKKRWSLLGKVLSKSASQHTDSMSDDDSYNEDEGSLPLPNKDGTGLKQGSSTKLPHSDSVIANIPEREFKFFLGFHYQQSPIEDRLLIRPRLPAPAQSRIRSRIRGESPPPSASRPPATRMVSGSTNIGLVSEARNATTSTTPSTIDSRKRSLSFGKLASLTMETSSSSELSESTIVGKSANTSTTTIVHGAMEESASPTPVEAKKPVGHYARTAVYCGRALAEWAQIVNEYNSFVERRRAEGVLGLSEMEVPTLGVETFRRMAGF